MAKLWLRRALRLKEAKKHHAEWTEQQKRADEG
jgi:hypothetical protein